jgi:hypothetical protein
MMHAQNLVPCQRPTYSGLEGKQKEGKEVEKEKEEEKEEEGRKDSRE